MEFLKQIIKFQLVNGGFKSTLIGTIQNVNWNQSCSILNNIGVISSKFINKFVQKCQC